MNNLITLLEFLAQRRKAVIAFLAGVYGLIVLYRALIADGSLSLDDELTLLAAVVGALGGTVGVHQASNKVSGN